jgi:hypothetical protein
MQWKVAGGGWGWLGATGGGWRQLEAVGGGWRQLEAAETLLLCHSYKDKLVKNLLRPCNLSLGA